LEGLPALVSSFSSPGRRRAAPARGVPLGPLQGLASPPVTPAGFSAAVDQLNAKATKPEQKHGKAVILTDGKAGTVESVWLDEMHGLRISVRGHDGRWPMSTIKFAQAG
jgi:hypothetical protein